MFDSEDQATLAGDLLVCAPVIGPRIARRSAAAGLIFLAIPATGCAIKGATYRFDVSGDQKWHDASISCGADGWTSQSPPWYKEAVVKHFEDDRRLPAANWFVVVGALDEIELFRIGSGGDFTASREADLYAFAGDLKTQYANNSGQLKVAVRRGA